MDNFTNRLVQSECGTPNPLVRAANQIGGNSKTTSLANMARAVASKRLTSGAKMSNAFVNEFLNRPSQLSPVLAIPSTSQTAISASRVDHEMARNIHRLNLNSMTATPSSNNLSSANVSSMTSIDARTHFSQHHHQNYSNPATTTMTAADQLDIKYRQDLLAQMATTNTQFLKADAEYQSIVNNLQNSSKQNQQQLNNEEATTSEPITNEDGGDLEFWQSLAQKYNENGEISQMVDEKLWYQFDQKEQLEKEVQNTDGSIKVGTDYNFDDTNTIKDTFEDPFAEGLRKLEIGDIPSAVLLFEAAVQKDNRNATAWRYLGTTQAQNENDKLAIKALRASLELNQNDYTTMFALAVSSANEGCHQAACDNLCTWLSKQSKYSQLVDTQQYHLSKLNSTTFNQDQIGETAYNYVKNAFIKAARTSPDHVDADVQSALGVLFNLRGDYDKAVDCFKAALSVRRDDSLLWNRLGATLANGNNSEEAVAAYRQALNISPGFLRSRFNLALSCVNLGAYKEAAEQLVTILNIQTNGRGINNLAPSRSRSRSVTSTNIWNTLRTVVTLMNRPDLYPLVDSRDFNALNRELLSSASLSTSDSSTK